MSKPFVHLHLHTEYSVLDGLGKIGDYALKAIENNMPALAITDHGNMYGVKDFFDTVTKVSKAKGVALKPIIGCEVYVNPEGRFSKRGKEDQGANHLILLAKNKQGYHNLVKICSIGYIEGFYYHPKIDREVLEKYHDGLICCSACLAGELPKAILQGRMEDAEEIATWYKNLFGDDYYFEIQYHPTRLPDLSPEVADAQKKVNPILFEMAARMGIKCIATNDCHFVNKEDGPVHDRLICLTTNSNFADKNRLRYTQEEYMKTYDEMLELNPEHPEILDNTLEIAEKVEQYSINESHILPIFILPKGYEDSNEYLKDLVYKGARERYESITPQIQERIDFELNTIKGMGFPDYFLIVQDFISTARSNGIWVGPGRGSAAGSIVAYCLKITNIDPLKYDLLFERFLNPDRISMPDIDIDFEEERRAEVYEYVENKYGKDHVSHVVTFNRMAAKSAIKDMCRIEGVDLATSNELSNLIPPKQFEVKIKKTQEDGKTVEEVETVPPTFENCLKYVPEFQKEYENSRSEQVKEALYFAKETEGTVRAPGVHACAVIIGRDNLTKFIPISITKDKSSGEIIWVSQFEGKHIESVGMLKMDFLGLRTLSILKETLENIKKTKGLEIDIEKIPNNDKKTFDLFGRGDTIATFQFESPGMQRWLRELKPQRFEDLIAMNALYRPGPMQYIPDFVNRKNKRARIEYEIPQMAEILSDTYGITVYQEQVMLLSQKLAGFTRGEADTLRKAMGKKNADILKTLEDKFFAGGVANGYPKEKLEKIWGDWRKFAKYAFNKSHSTCYAWVGYQTAYFKAHFPAEFLAANLTKNISDIKQITGLMEDCKRHGIKVLGPDINESGTNFTVVQLHRGGKVTEAIRFGLAAIKGMGTAVSDDIIAGAPYSDIFDFIERAGKNGNINRKSLEVLAQAGAFDSSFPQIRRDQYFATNAKGETFLDLLVEYGQKIGKGQSDMGSLFSSSDEGFQVPKPTIPPPPKEYNKLEFLKREKEVVGMYLSSHPLDRYRFEVAHFADITPEILLRLKQTKVYADNGEMTTEAKSLIEKSFHVVGMVSDLEKKVSQKGNPYATFTLEDFNSQIKFSIFGKDYESFIPLLDVGNALYMKIKFRLRRQTQGVASIEPMIVSIKFLSNVKEEILKSITVRVPYKKISEDFRKEFVELLSKNKSSAISRQIKREGGNDETLVVSKVPVNIQIIEDGKGFALNYKTKFVVEVSDELLSDLEKMGLEVVPQIQSID